MIYGRKWEPAPDILEAPFQDAIAELARTVGWRVAHFRPAQTARGRHITPVKYDGKGFPDLILAHTTSADGYPSIIFAEIKRNTTHLTPDQAVWNAALSLACERRQGIDVGGHTVYPDMPSAICVVWRPCDWPTIVNTLTFGQGTTTTR